MRSTHLSGSAEPWYRQGWPWFLITIPAVAVVAGLATVWIAVSTSDGLVVDDYYQEGKAIEKTMARSALAATLGLSAELTIRAESVTLALTAADSGSIPETVVLTIAHPTRAGQDHVLTMVREGGRFTAPLAPLSAGRWLLQLEDGSRKWRMTGEALVPAEGVVRIVPYQS